MEYGLFMIHLWSIIFIRKGVVFVFLCRRDWVKVCVCVCVCVCLGEGGERRGM